LPCRAAAFGGRHVGLILLNKVGGLPVLGDPFVGLDARSEAEQRLMCAIVADDLDLEP
jgi:hypothetical protein